MIVSQDMADGNSIGDRFSNVLGRGIASHTSTAMAVSQQASNSFTKRSPAQPGIAEFSFPRR